ncbi:CDP-glycerol glycerophosphotransferase family protein [Lentilactobacillus sp. Marseille-Q4993]|uniref:CDP-glycerol glycerophosphotransferase family protein n=1 Tax=Lentilactobacillus sp. Marseille-Q4993 TaxID=3039492 RepID=UPI0024BCCBF7|nr:CDP-glycerol glycerophosphotransferase family protein [Lentilactobacillus sp. Marseille-Q4993]
MSNKLVKLLKLIARYGLIVINDGFICMPVKKGRMVFESFNGNNINDNPYAIYQEVIRQNPEQTGELYFSVKPREFERLHQAFPTVKLIKRFSLKWVKLLATADYWVFNSRMPNWWKKNSRTTYVQTWHGTPLKKLGIDIENVEIPGTSTEKYHRDFANEANRWEYLIAPNEYSQKIFTSAFAFNNNYLPVGYPRNDVLYTANNQKSIVEIKKRLFGFVPNKVILYAPTWRDDDAKAQGVYNFELPFSLASFFEQIDDDTQLIIRPHYLVKDKINIDGYENRVKILADEDINQLYLISDLLITDYSSVMFDFANLMRPILFYSYDLEHYRDELRGFYFDYNESELPGPLVTDTDSFYSRISEFDKKGNYPEFQANLERFNQRFCAWEDGTAAKRVVNEILGRKHNE